MSASVYKGVVLEEEKLKRLIKKAKLWALLSGVQMRPQADAMSESQVEYAPMTLFPSLVPASVLTEAGSLQTAFNTLMHKVAHDHEFLEKSLRNVVKVDSFTKMLWDIYIKVREEGNPQEMSLGMFRNDYMMDVKDGSYDDQGIPSHVQIKQIEFNMIASSFAGLSTTIGKVHRYNLKQAGIKFDPQTNLIDNKPAHNLAKGFVEAWKQYQNKSAVIVFIVMAAERNAIDQKLIEKEIFDLEPDIRVEYTTMKHVFDHASLTQDKRLILDGQEVAVIYFRDGYSPTSYTSDKEVEARLRMERSLAIKCPSIHYQLAGCKKIQQELAAPGALERFVEDPQLRDRIQKTFAQQFPLDKGEEGDKGFALAMKNPEKFVLKPQREGGGNNVYGEDIRAYLAKIEDSDERSAFILMERIFPWKQRNFLLKEGQDWHDREVVSELGIYGVYMGSPSKELYNEIAGLLLRTKSSDDNEGGIVAGFATIDSPFVIDML